MLHDILGLTTGSVPKHAKQYAHLATVIEGALRTYMQEVQAGDFPGEEHSHPLDREVLEQLSAPTLRE